MFHSDSLSIILTAVLFLLRSHVRAVWILNRKHLKFNQSLNARKNLKLPLCTKLDQFRIEKVTDHEQAFWRPPIKKRWEYCYCNRNMALIFTLDAKVQVRRVQVSLEIFWFLNTEAPSPNWPTFWLVHCCFHFQYGPRNKLKLFCGICFLALHHIV